MRAEGHGWLAEVKLQEVLTKASEQYLGGQGLVRGPIHPLCVSGLLSEHSHVHWFTHKAEVSCCHRDQVAYKA